MMLLCVLYSCTNREKKSSNEQKVIPIELDFKGKTKSIHSINLIKDVDIINLDCDEVIGAIDKVIKFKNNIYLLDLFQNRCIYIFDDKGKFINKISNYGRGPKEYNQLTDIFINEKDSTLNVLSRVDKKLFRYDMDGKKMLSTERMPKSFSTMLKTENGYVANMGYYEENINKPFNIWILNDDFKLVGSSFKIDKTLKSNSIEGSVLSRFGKNIYYLKTGDYNIYSSSSDGKEKIRYSFDLKDLELPIVTNKEKKESRNQYVERFRNFQETNKYLIVRVIYNGQYLLGVYCKADKSTNIVTLEPYEDKYFFSFGDIVGFDENAIYSINDASRIKKYWDGKDAYNNFEEDYPQQVKNLRTKFKSIKEEGNPFLIIYSLN